MNQTLKKLTWGQLLATTALLVVLVIVVSGPAAAHGGDDGSHHHDRWMDSHGGVSYLWVFVVLIGITLGSGYLLLTWYKADGEQSDDAVSTLRRRYAEGEIDEEEFDSRRRKLQGDR